MSFRRSQRANFLRFESTASGGARTIALATGEPFEVSEVQLITGPNDAQAGLGILHPKLFHNKAMAAVSAEGHGDTPPRRLVFFVHRVGRHVLSLRGFERFFGPIDKCPYACRLVTCPWI